MSRIERMESGKSSIEPHPTPPAWIGGVGFSKEWGV